jgi:hypothetical protein
MEVDVWPRSRDPLRIDGVQHLLRGELPAHPGAPDELVLEGPGTSLQSSPQ